jgi:hypothetical protein
MNEYADVLSRRDQDLPVDGSDERLAERNMRLIKPEWLTRKITKSSSVKTTRNNRLQVMVAPSTISLPRPAG